MVMGKVVELLQLESVAAGVQVPPFVGEQYSTLP
jgi:hypothetical protein